MELLDSRNKVLEKGLTVRYIGTGTIGEITDMKNEEEFGWVQIDENGLWYNSSYVEIIEKREKQTITKKEQNIEEEVEKIKNKLKLDDIDMSNSGACEGGG
jgi:hypothetical protein